MEAIYEQEPDKFKIDLIVWKQTQQIEFKCADDEFKIDLIVWKLEYRTTK